MNEEAINELDKIRVCSALECDDSCAFYQSKEKICKRDIALATAIKALREQRPRGKWIEVEVHNCHATLKCSECDRVIEPTFTFGEYSYEDIKEFYPFCHCGAKMKEEVL